MILQTHVAALSGLCFVLSIKEKKKQKEVLLSNSCHKFTNKHIPATNATVAIFLCLVHLTECTLSMKGVKKD